MQAVASRIIFHVDLDYFFAQCEEVRNPSLRDRPVVVCVYSGRTKDSGAVSTANYHARRMGVRSGIPIITAKGILKEANAEFLPVDHAYYEEMSVKTMSILREFSDRFEQVSVDEAYVDVAQKAQRDYQQAREIALSVKTRIRQETGLTCSIGIGPNKVVAKIAAGLEKPDGLTLVTPEKTKEFLDPMPVDKLPGVGVKTKERLEALGIKTIGQLASHDPQKLIDYFGMKMGGYFYQAANGIDDDPVQESDEIDQISRIATLKENTRDMSIITPELNRLAESVTQLAAETGVAFKSVAIIAITEDLKIHTRSRTLEKPSNNPDILKEIARELFHKYLENEAQLNVRRIGVKVSNLVRHAPQEELSKYFS